MNDIFEVASWVSEQLTALQLDHCFIGGLALQVWGEARVTRDVDLTVLTRFDNEEQKVRQILDVMPPRIVGALEHALRYRVLLCQSPSGIGIDMGLGGFAFEEGAFERSGRHEFLPGITLPVVSAEDLIIMKVFAGRPRDWEDVSGILIRQGNLLEWEHIVLTLPDLLDAIEEPERIDRLLALRASLGE